MRPTPCSSAVASSSRRLVVAVQDRGARRGTPADERDVELAAGRDVEVHTLLVGEPGHGPAQEGLRGVGDTVAPGRHRLPAGVAQMVLVVDEERRAELLGQLEEVDATDVEVALLVHRRGPRQQARAPEGAVATSWSVGMEMQDTAAFACHGDRAGGTGGRTLDE